MKEAIEKLFEKHEHQFDVLVGIYRLVFPDYDEIEKIVGYPKIGTIGWNWICKQFMDFDRKHHPEVMGGGLWLNNGFSHDKELGDFEISLKNCSVIKAV